VTTVVWLREQLASDRADRAAVESAALFFDEHFTEHQVATPVVSTSYPLSHWNSDQYATGSRGSHLRSFAKRIQAGSRPR
jgi:hypothetical protein